MQEGDCANMKMQQVMQLRKDTIKNKHTNRHVSVLTGPYYLNKSSAVKRCRKSEQDSFANFKKTQIFQLVHTFVNRLLQDEDYLQHVIHEIKFNQYQVETKLINYKYKYQKINSTNQLNQNIKQKSSNVEINVISVDCEERNQNEIKKEQEYLMPIDDNKLGNYLQSNSNIANKTNTKKTAKSTKKISIMLQSDNLQLTPQKSTNNPSSTLFSQQSLCTNISSMQIIQQQLTMKMIEAIYEQPQPFLINLSVCLMLKYLHRSKTKLNKKNVCWILSVGTIIAYKLYYDEPVEGLVDSFGEILKLSEKDIVTLERNFLKEIEYQAVISSQQYHATLYHIIKQGKY